MKTLLTKEELMNQSVEDLADTIIECRNRIELLRKQLKNSQEEANQLFQFKQNTFHPVGY